MELKVGDKVKVVYNSNRSDIVKRAMNKTGIVKSMGLELVYVEFGEEIWGGYLAIGFYENEIEPVIMKGQQLLLFEL